MWFLPFVKAYIEALAGVGWPAIVVRHDGEKEEQARKETRMSGYASRNVTNIGKTS